jgi:hypothetical protein
MATSARFSLDRGGNSKWKIDEEPKAKCCRCLEISDAFRVREGLVCGFCICSMLSGRIRRNLSKSIVAGSSVSFVFDGSPASCVLLDVVYRSMDVGMRQRMFENVYVFIIDTTSLEKVFQISERDCNGVKRLVTLVSRYHFSPIIVPIEASIDVLNMEQFVFQVPIPSIPTRPKGWHVHLNPIDLLGDSNDEINLNVDRFLANLDAYRSSVPFQSAHEKLIQLFENLRNIDDKRDVLQSLIERVGISLSACGDIRFMMKNDTITSMARKILGNTCNGVGYSIPLDVSMLDFRFAKGVPRYEEMKPFSILSSDWYETKLVNSSVKPHRGGIVVAKPMLEIEDQECIIYCKYMGISCHSSILDSPNLAHGSIDSAVSNLLNTLQSSFSSTVHNVVRTAKKLAIPSNAPIDVFGESHADFSFDESEIVDGDSTSNEFLCKFCSGLLEPKSQSEYCLKCERIHSTLHFTKI